MLDTLALMGFPLLKTNCACLTLLLMHQNWWSTTAVANKYVMSTQMQLIEVNSVGFDGI